MVRSQKHFEGRADRVIKYIKESINKREESRMKGLGSEQWEEWIFL